MIPRRLWGYGLGGGRGCPVGQAICDAGSMKKDENGKDVFEPVCPPGS